MASPPAPLPQPCPPDGVALAADDISPPAPTPTHIRVESRFKTLLSSLLGLFSHEPDRSLLSFEQVQKLLRSRTAYNRGTQFIPVDHIVGSVGRYRDFNRAFLPLNPAVSEHLRRMEDAVREGAAFPPIDVYAIGGVYFVRDGNHRVALARQLKHDHIEAHVSEILSRVALAPDVDVDDLIVKAEHTAFLEATRLDAARPDARVELTAPGRYDSLLEHIEVHRYYLGLEKQRDVPLEEAATSWFDTVYVPVIDSIRETGVLREFPRRTEADLYLWVAYHRERLRESGCLPDNRRVASALAEQFSDRPVARLVKSVARAVRAAMQAVTETPEPPEMNTP